MRTPGQEPLQNHRGAVRCGECGHDVDRPWINISIAIDRFNRKKRIAKTPESLADTIRHKLEENGQLEPAEIRVLIAFGKPGRWKVHRAVEEETSRPLCGQHGTKRLTRKTGPVSLPEVRTPDET